VQAAFHLLYFFYDLPPAKAKSYALAFATPPPLNTKMAFGPPNTIRMIVLFVLTPGNTTQVAGPSEGTPFPPFLLFGYPPLLFY